MPIPSQAAAERWNKDMRHFRFHFAHGGHANDMDIIAASIRFVRGEAGLLALFGKLELSLARIPPEMPRRESGRSYNSADPTRYADPIRAYPDFESPGFVNLFDTPVNLTVLSDQVVIYVSGADGDVWSVTERNYRNALRLETIFAGRGIEFVDG